MIRLSLSQALQYRKAMVKSSEALTDEDALTAPMLFPRWESDGEYTTGDRLYYDGNLYKVLLDHTAQADWTPDVAVSLYVRVDDPSVEWPDWRQPQGAHDAYMAGDKVSHVNKHWVSDVDYNTYEPGVYGWTEAN